MKRIVTFDPAYDKRSKDPSKNYGIHGVNMRMVLKGNKGAVQFIVFTNWELPHVQREMDSKPLNNFPYMFHKPMPADVGYHSPVPMYKGQGPSSKSCEYLDGKPCYYDGSGLHAEKVFDILLKGGSDAVWQYLEKYYNEQFGEDATQ